MLCRQCKNEIPDGAKLCSQCDSYQDWRGILPISSTALALLVALVTAISSALPVLSSYFHVPAAEIEFSSPIIQDETVSVIASNVGDRPGTLYGATLHSRVMRDIPVKLVDPSSAFIPVGSKQVVFKINLGMWWKDALEIADDPRLTSDKDKSFLEVLAVSRDSKLVRQDIKLPAGMYRDLLRFHADRCAREESKKEASPSCKGSRGVTVDFSGDEPVVTFDPKE
jgi:hypothetical protein